MLERVQYSGGGISVRRFTSNRKVSTLNIKFSKAIEGYRISSLANGYSQSTIDLCQYALSIPNQHSLQQTNYECRAADTLPPASDHILGTNPRHIWDIAVIFDRFTPQPSY
jgi:hypothetical protein